MTDDDDEHQADNDDDNCGGVSGGKLNIFLL